MTIFDLPDTPDNVHSINIGKYIANMWNRVPICRLRPKNTPNKRNAD